MVSIQHIKNGQIIEIGDNQLYSSILDVCEDHRKSDRALAFGIIIYNFKNPQIIKILDDSDYWMALHSTAGKYLSIFNVAQPDDYFAQDLIESDDKEERGLHKLKGNIAPILKGYFEMDEKVLLPTILFFQVEDKMINDYFLIPLNERKIEDSFWELQSYLESAVKSLERVKKENYRNSQAIFNLLKRGVNETKLRKKFFKITQKFPVQIFTGWIVGKI